MSKNTIASLDKNILPQLNAKLKELYDSISRVQYRKVADASVSPSKGTSGQMILFDDGTSQVFWVKAGNTWYDIGDVISSLTDHTHSATSGQGGQLDWDSIWTDAVHSHASNAEGGTLDWDTCFADAVHTHQSNAEGGTIKLDDLATPDDNTDLNASTSTHGLVVKATAPASGLQNVVGIGNAETAYTNKALFDNTNPADVGVAASPGTSLIAARRDHVHVGSTEWDGNIADIEIDEATEAGAPITDSTLFIGDMNGAGDNHSILASRLKTYIGVALTLISAVNCYGGSFISRSLGDLVCTITVVST